jgi:uncharacterized membrane protein
MEIQAKALGHSIHPMLIVYPLGLLSTAVVFDILYLITDRSGFWVAAAYAIAAGIIGGLVAALFGLVDWLGIPAGTRAKSVGAVHGLSNVVVLLLFAVSWLLRAGADDWKPSALAITLGIIGLVASTAAAWFGGELVERLGVGVHPNAGLNAPSSLAGLKRPASSSG